VEFWKKLAWLGGRRTAWIAGPVAGFVIALLVFKWPGHLAAAWGDVPTWILAVFAVFGAALALSQLSILRQQAADAAITERRRQAEEVEATSRGTGFGVIENNSRRPITDLTSRVVSRKDGRIVAVPDRSGSVVAGVHQGTLRMGPDAEEVTQVDVLRPQRRCGFAFDSVADDQDHVFVAWFTDDAGFRWQLDQNMHLVEADDGDVYKP